MQSSVERELEEFVKDAVERAGRSNTGNRQPMHLAFVGNFGSGRSQAAQSLAEMLEASGMISKGQVVSVAAAELQGRYLGEVEDRVRDVFGQAQGGVLLIEVDSLIGSDEPGGLYGQSLLSAIVAGMEDRSNEVVVILKAYPEEMGQLLDANPGLASRIRERIHFPDYSTKELTEIVSDMVTRAGWDLSPRAKKRLKRLFGELRSDGPPVNGRMAREVAEACIAEAMVREVEGLSNQSDSGDSGDGLGMGVIRLEDVESVARRVKPSSKGGIVNSWFRRTLNWFFGRSR